MRVELEAGAGSLDVWMRLHVRELVLAGAVGDGDLLRMEGRFGRFLLLEPAWRGPDARALADEPFKVLARRISGARR